MVCESFAGRAVLHEVILQIDEVAPEKHHGCEAGAGDCVAFGNRFHRIADRVELIGGFAHFAGKFAHDGDAARVVRNWAECVEGDDDSSHGEHRHHRDGDAVKTGKCVAAPNGRSDAEHHGRRGLLADGESGDDVRRVSGFGRLGDFAHRAVFRGCVVVCDPASEAGHHEAHEAREENAIGSENLAALHREACREHLLRDWPECGC